jgi:hypothetical protein
MQLNAGDMYLHPAKHHILSSDQENSIGLVIEEESVRSKFERWITLVLRKLQP